MLAEGIAQKKTRLANGQVKNSWREASGRVL